MLSGDGEWPLLCGSAYSTFLLVLFVAFRTMTTLCMERRPVSRASSVKASLVRRSHWLFGCHRKKTKETEANSTQAQNKN